MADADHHLNHHRPNRLSLPSRPTSAAALVATPRPYPDFVYTPTPTPSKLRRSLSLTHRSPPATKSSLSFLLLLLFSLRSLYSLLPFLQSSSPSFSLFPFTFLVSLFSFLLSLSFSAFSSSSYRDSFKGSGRSLKRPPILSLDSIAPPQQKLLVAKSTLLAVVFLLRFQALRYCGTAALIIAELSGTVAARFLSELKSGGGAKSAAKVRGFLCLLIGLLLLSVSWDRVECFPFSAARFGKWGFPGKACVRVWPMLLPFMSGFLGSYERQMMNWGSIKQLGQKRVRLICLFYATAMLFAPAAVSYLVYGEGDGVSIGTLVWPLANMVVFGVLLSENYSDEKVGSSRNSQREFLVTFACLVVLELFYFPNLSLWGLVICGLLIWIAVGELSRNESGYVEIGMESSESLFSSTMKAVRHILTERKSRKIALFLLINTSYMVVEFVVGFMCNSLGLISDACHMLFDCAALAIGLYASYISRLPANHQFNYGRGRFEVLSGYANAVFLVLVGALIVLESIERILDPQEISTNSLLTVSIGGLVVNMIGLIFFHDEHHHAHGGSGPCSHSHGQESHSHVGTDHQKSHHPLLKCHSASHDAHECVVDDPKHGHHHKGHQCNHSAPCSDSIQEQIGKSPVSLGHHHNHCNHDHHQDHNTHRHDHHHNHCNHDHHQDHNTHRHDHQHHHDSQDSHSHKHRDSQESCTTHSSHLKRVEVHSHGRHSDGTMPVEPPKKHHRHRHVDHNMEGIFLHVLADTMGSVGVVLSTLLIKYKGWLIADPASSIFISILIVSSVIPLLRNSAEILLQRVPRAHEAELREALENIMNIEEVRGVQNMHVWSFSTTEVVGTLHLHVSTESDKASAKARVSELLHDAGVQDLTLQVECLNHC